MSKESSPPSTPVLSRRTVTMGAGVLGALGAVVATTAGPKLVATAPAAAGPVAAAADGYQLTDHVKQYYATARV